MTGLPTPTGGDPQPGARSRRGFLGVLGGGVAAAVLVSPTRAQLGALARVGRTGDGFGKLGPPDELGVRVPAGFATRLVARSGDTVAPTDLRWHGAPDGGACFPATDGNDHVYVSNSELSDGAGGASAVAFDSLGRTVAARTILAGTSRNCAGGATPWGTWLSCEENGRAGQVWECHPDGGDARVRPAMGSFNHEAAAVDPIGGHVYLTEDKPQGRLYRFRPRRWPDLAAGDLAAAVFDSASGTVSWLDVDPGFPDRSATTTAFHGGEGAVVIGRSLFFSTKGDRRIWELDLERHRLAVFHDCLDRPDTPLTHVDNLAVHPITGSLFVAEDGGDLDLCMLVRTPAGPSVTRVVRFVGHDDSEVTGPAFSPDGRFLYLSSQRGTDGAGVTVQVTGPFGSMIEAIGGPAWGDRPARRIGNGAPIVTTQSR